MNSFQIKLIALILMTIDHIGEFLFPQCDLLGYIGRLSAPLFLYILWYFYMFAGGQSRPPLHIIYYIKCVIFIHTNYNL